MMDDEMEYLQPVLGLSPNQRFKPLKSTWVAMILLFLLMVMEAAGLLMVFFWPNTDRHLHCEPFYLLLYCQASLWFLVLLIDHVLKWHHNKLRLEGYLAVYEKVNKFGSLPFYIVSLCSTCMLLMTALYQHTHPMFELTCATHDWTSPLMGALGIISVQTALLVYILAVYIVLVHQFNFAKQPPDVHQPDTWEDFTNHEVGYRERGDDVQEMLQKQANTIRYYKDAVAALQEKVMGLTAQLRADPIN